MLMPEEKKTAFEALHTFRALKDDNERMEAMFLGQYETLLRMDNMLARQDVTNGNVKETKVGLGNLRQELSEHLDEHEAQQNGIDYIKRMGARGTAFILFVLAIIGGIEAIVLILHYGFGVGSYR